MSAAPETPVFAAPWQAQIFALVVALEKDGHFAWSRFQALLTDAIAAAPIAEQGPDFYYRHWLAAADRLLTELGFVDATAWRVRIDRIATARPKDHDAAQDHSTHHHHHH